MHLESEAQELIQASMKENNVVATSLDDLRPAEVPIEHHFELNDPNPI